MLEARRSELLGRARARAYGERTTTSPTEKSPCYVSLLCSYIEGWCARVYRLRGGRGWQRRVRTEREREVGLCFACFWGFSAAPGAVYVREGKR